MTIGDIVRTGLSRIETIRTRTALNPLLWVLGLSLPLIFGSAVLIPNPVIQLTLIGLAGGSIFLTFVAYFATLFREPERLQSEEFVLRQLELKITERKQLPPATSDTPLIDDTSGHLPPPEKKR